VIERYQSRKNDFITDAITYSEKREEAKEEEICGR
jgi:hypothetical protein